MAFSNDKFLIKSLYELKEYNACQFMMEFTNKNWKKCSTSSLLQKLRDDCTVRSDLKQRIIDAWASISKN